MSKDKEARRQETAERRAARGTIEKRIADKKACGAPGCRCESVPRDNPDCEAHDEPAPRQAEDGFEVVFDEVEVADAAPTCLDCGGPEGGGNCTRCSFKEPTRPHMLAGFGGGPRDIPSCQVCGEVAPPSFAECPGAPAVDDTYPSNAAADSERGY